ncbi:hypothetical protein TBDG_00937 [Mycobacterium tuberculosis T92]|nr:hypothetical protein TBDG_00937 [Mycobacterium tuberculosis T92]
MLRAYDYAGDEVVLMHADDIRLRRWRWFDVLINTPTARAVNILVRIDGQVYGVDHELCLHVEEQAAHRAVGWWQAD